MLIPGVGTILTLIHFAVAILYPTFESFKAIESTGSKDDTQWLSYWVVYALYQFAEKFLWIILAWIPLYRIARIALMAWLVAPQTRGAALVYQTYARPILFALVDKARDIPALEPYTRDIGSPISQVAKKAEGAVTDAKESFAPLKAHAT
ncbi:hypothetical protein Ndes2526B_g00364 [Nannochloris sp. 'desiccata']|nr:hypothetical protein KSW81_003148 [Chlorella desiccata (nom. nud.)]KAH7624989.1 putative Receptor expression-enhancing protein 5 [Chlorella desiccata (nom. nud.)]